MSHQYDYYSQRAIITKITLGQHCPNKITESCVIILYTKYTHYEPTISLCCKKSHLSEQ